jgi:hypothetical protein
MLNFSEAETKSIVAAREALNKNVPEKAVKKGVMAMFNKGKK